MEFLKTNREKFTVSLRKNSRFKIKLTIYIFEIKRDNFQQKST